MVSDSKTQEIPVPLPRRSSGLRQSGGGIWSLGAVVIALLVVAPILSVVMDHFVSGAPLVRAGAAAVDDDGAPDSEIVAEIKGLLDSRIRPAVAQDGGDILFDHFDEDTGVLRLRMRGACAAAGRCFGQVGCAGRSLSG